MNVNKEPKNLTIEWIQAEHPNGNTVDLMSGDHPLRSSGNFKTEI